MRWARINRRSLPRTPVYIETFFEAVTMRSVFGAIERMLILPVKILTVDLEFEKAAALTERSDH